MIHETILNKSTKSTVPDFLDRLCYHTHISVQLLHGVLSSAEHCAICQRYSPSFIAPIRPRAQQGYGISGAELCA